MRWNQQPSHTAYFSSFVPLTAWTHKATPVPHRLEFIYGVKSIEERHISICFLNPPEGESFLDLFKLWSAIGPGLCWTVWAEKLITFLPCAIAISFPKSFFFSMLKDALVNAEGKKMFHFISKMPRMPCESLNTWSVSFLLHLPMDRRPAAVMRLIQ